MWPRDYENEARKPSKRGLVTYSKASFDLKKEVKVVSVSSNVLVQDKAASDEDDLPDIVDRDEIDEDGHFERATSSDDFSKSDRSSGVMVPMVVQEEWRVERRQRLWKDESFSGKHAAGFQWSCAACDANSTSDEAATDNGQRSTCTCDKNQLENEEIISKGKRASSVILFPQETEELDCVADSTEKSIVRMGSSDRRDRKSNENCETLKASSVVKIVTGEHRGAYGRIEGFAEDDSSVIVRLTASGRTVYVSRFSVVVVSENEIKPSVKYIDEKTRDQEKSKNEEIIVHSEYEACGSYVSTRTRTSDTIEKEKQDSCCGIAHSRKRKFLEITTPKGLVMEDEGVKCGRVFAGKALSMEDEDSKVLEKENEDVEYSLKAPGDGKRDCSCARSTDTGASCGRRGSKAWVRRNVKVRFVDRNFQDGKLFNEKVVVVEVGKETDCTIADCRRKLYYGVRQDWLETLKPDVEDTVMVVAGSNIGKVGVVIAMNDRTQLLDMMLAHTGEIIEVAFDDVTEYVGHSDDLDLLDF